MLITFQTIIDTIVKTNDYGIELITKVDSFYTSAWDKLIVVGSVAFGVIGIIVPFVIQWYQKEKMKISEDLMKIELENQSLRLKQELLDDINKKIDDKVQIFEDKIKKAKASSNAKAFHLQGNRQLEIGCYSEALSDYVFCSKDYLYCEDFSNLQTALRLIYDECMPELSVEEITDLKISHNCDLETLLEEITDMDEKGAFSQLIRDIKLRFSKLPKTMLDKQSVKRKS